MKFFVISMSFLGIACASTFGRVQTAVDNHDIETLSSMEKEGVLVKHMAENASNLELHYKFAARERTGLSVEYLARQALVEKLDANRIVQLLLDECQHNQPHEIQYYVQKKNIRCNAAIEQLLQHSAWKFNDDTRLAICLSNDEKIFQSAHAAAAPKSAKFIVGNRAHWYSAKTKRLREVTVVRVCQSGGKNFYGVEAKGERKNRGDGHA